MNPIHEVEFEDLDSSGREELELRDAPEVQAGPAGEYIRIELLADKYPFNAPFLIFGNMELIVSFHKEAILRPLETAADWKDKPSLVADIFIENSEELLKLYCR